MVKSLWPHFLAHPVHFIPHAAHCYKRRNIPWSVCQRVCVCLLGTPVRPQNGWTDRDAVSGVTSREPKNHVLTAFMLSPPGVKLRWPLVNRAWWIRTLCWNWTWSRQSSSSAFAPSPQLADVVCDDYDVLAHSNNYPYRFMAHEHHMCLQYNKCAGLQ